MVSSPTEFGTLFALHPISRLYEGRRVLEPEGHAGRDPRHRRELAVVIPAGTNSSHQTDHPPADLAAVGRVLDPGDPDGTARAPVEAGVADVRHGATDGETDRLPQPPPEPEPVVVEGVDVALHEGGADTETGVGDEIRGLAEVILDRSHGPTAERRRDATEADRTAFATEAEVEPRLGRRTGLPIPTVTAGNAVGPWLALRANAQPGHHITGAGSAVGVGVAERGL